MDEEEGMGWSDERSSNNWPSSRTIWRQVKRMGWDDQMRGLQTLHQVHVHSGRRVKRMGWDDQLRVLQTIDCVHVLSGDGWKEWDDKIRWEVFKQLIKFTYPLERESYQKQEQNLIDKFTYFLEMHKEDGMIRWEVLKQLAKFTYFKFLETDEEKGMRWSDERSSNN